MTSNVSKKTVTVMGLGSIGSSVAESLARLGVNMRVIDRDRIKVEDVPLLSLFGREHVAKFKAKEAKKILDALDPNLKIKAFHEDIVSTNAFLADADVIVECSNDVNTALLIDKAVKKTPIVYVRACGETGYVFIADQTRLKDLEGFLRRIQPPSPSTLRSTSQIAAGFAVNKVMKLLTGQKTEKNCLVIDSIKYSVQKVPVRKGLK